MKKKDVLVFGADQSRVGPTALVVELWGFRAVKVLSPVDLAPSIRAAANLGCVIWLNTGKDQAFRDAFSAAAADVPTVLVSASRMERETTPAARSVDGASMLILRDTIRMACARRRGPRRRSA